MIPSAPSTKQLATYPLAPRHRPLQPDIPPNYRTAAYFPKHLRHHPQHPLVPVPSQNYAKPIRRGISEPNVIDHPPSNANENRFAQQQNGSNWKTKGSTAAAQTTNFVNLFEELEVIGKGSFGLIRKVRRRSDGKILARKEIDYKQMSPKERTQLYNEVTILTKLNHPHIVNSFERHNDSERCIIYLVLEYCEGGDLGAYVKKCKNDGTPIPEDRVWAFLVQLLHALHKCHSHRPAVLHRDLKPENVMLDSRYNIKLGDFGLSTMVEDAESAFGRTFVGTPFYMSPELMHESSYNVKSDMWALGCLVYELCALEPPFQAKTHAALAKRVKEGRAPPLPGHYSRALNGLVQELLQLDHRLRPSAAALLSREVPISVDMRGTLLLSAKEYKERLECLQAECLRRQTETLRKDEDREKKQMEWKKKEGEWRKKEEEWKVKETEWRKKEEDFKKMEEERVKVEHTIATIKENLTEREKQLRQREAAVRRIEEDSGANSVDACRQSQTPVEVSSLVPAGDRWSNGQLQKPISPTRRPLEDLSANAKLEDSENCMNNAQRWPAKGNNFYNKFSDPKPTEVSSGNNLNGGENSHRPNRDPFSEANKIANLRITPRRNQRNTMAFTERWQVPGRSSTAKPSPIRSGDHNLLSSGEANINSPTSYARSRKQRQSMPPPPPRPPSKLSQPPQQNLASSNPDVVPADVNKVSTISAKSADESGRTQLKEALDWYCTPSPFLDRRQTISHT